MPSEVIEIAGGLAVMLVRCSYANPMSVCVPLPHQPLYRAPRSIMYWRYSVVVVPP